jgi:RHS repeat-associated protein
LASASDADGTISKVEFYNGSTKLGEATTSPYSYTWTNVSAGSYTITAKATDNSQQSSTSAAATVVVNASVAPTVSLTSQQVSGNAPATVTLTASASDADGTISKVEFYNGSTKLGEATTSPYSYSWTNVSAGSYSITAKATDNSQLSTTSAAAAVAVNAAPPVAAGCSGTGSIVWEIWTGISGREVSLIPLNTSPTTTQTLSSFSIPAHTMEDYGSRVRGYICPPVSGDYVFYISSDNQGELWLSSGDQATGKQRIAWVPTVVGQNDYSTHASQQSAVITLQANQRYYVEALHKENGGGDHLQVAWKKPGDADKEIIPGASLIPFGTPAPVAPTVLLTSQQVSGSAPATVTLTASASDGDGTISKVEFYNGSTKLGEATTNPYTYSWINVQAGTYSITAKATDNSQQSTTSAAATVVVNAGPPVTAGCSGTGSITWEYWGGISGLEISHIPLNSPPTGTQTLNSFATPINTMDYYGSRIRGYLCPPVSGDYIFYFTTDDRGELWLSPNNQPSAKQQIAGVPDWAMPDEFTRFASQQSVAITLEANQRYYIEALQKEHGGGDHIIVAWKKPGDADKEIIPGTSLIPFDATPPAAPTVALTLHEVSGNAPATIALTASASYADGTISKVEFYNGSTKIGEALSSPYNCSWTNVPAGSYSITARATDNSQQITTSAAIVVVVNAAAPPAGGTSTLTIVIETSYDYDHSGRKKEVRQKINSEPELILARYSYNELGQLVDKQLHVNDATKTKGIQSVDYRYNIRGWLSSINDPASATVQNRLNHDTDEATDSDKFGFELQYETAGQYGGNIGAMKWKSARTGSPLMQYDFSYDPLNRLSKANSTRDNIQGGYNEELAYSKTGNIETLKRTAVVSGATQTIDDLKYTYTGNRSTRIDDEGTPGHKTLGFNEKAREADEIGFNDDGQMILDKNKGITGITYDANANISKISLDNTGTRYIEYEYNRLGAKLKKTSVNGTSVLVTEYADGIVYERQGSGSSRQLSFIQTVEGRARPGSSNFIYEYDLKDHLGNNRVTIKPKTIDPTQADIIQEKSYYAFGMEMDLGLAKQDYHKYLYNGKELQEELGQYDYGARFYDPETARWNVTDPLAENFSAHTPYNYVYNNPVNFTDPDGRSPYKSYNGYSGYGGYGGYVGYGGSNGYGGYNSMNTGGQYSGAFPTPGEARRYRREHNIHGKIVRGSDGIYSINDTRNGVSYFRDDSELGKLFITRGEDGVNIAPLAGANNGGFWDGFINATESNHFETSAAIGYGGTALDVGAALNKAAAYLPRTRFSRFSDLRSIVKTAKVLQNVGYGVGGLSTIAKGFEVFADGEVTLGEGVSLGISAISIAVPVVGIIDLGVEMTTGTSLSDRIGGGIDSALPQANYNFNRKW